MNAKTTKLALKHITVDLQLQMRVALDEEHVNDIAESLLEGKEVGVERPPVVFKGTGQNYLADGFHRHAAHVQAGKTSMMCDVRTGTWRDAWKYALSANATNAKRRTNDDKRRAVSAALADAETGKLSDGGIAELCAVSDRFVSSVRRELTPNGSESTERIGSDGRTINVANIGKGNHANTCHFETAEMIVLDAPAVADPPGPTDSAADVEPASSPASTAPADVQAADVDAVPFDTDDLTTGPAVACVPTDFLDRPLPEHLLSTFERVSEFNSLVQRLGGIMTDLKGLAGFRAGFWLDNHNGIINELENFQRTIRFAAPYCVCPACEGKGKITGENCKLCKGGQFVCKGNLSWMTTEQRKTAESFHKGDAWEPEQSTAAAA